MSTTQAAVNHWRSWLLLAAALLVPGLMIGAQGPETPQQSESDAAKSGMIIGKVAAGNKGISVVWVEALPGVAFPKPAKSMTVSQKNLRFEPHVLAVPVGATVDFLNGDNVAHNIFWPAISGNKKLSHSLGTWPKGQTRLFTFTTPGIVPLLCNVHPEMAAYIVVTPTPYFAQTDETGTFAIPAVPNGNYSVTAWHEGYKAQTKPVAVASDTTVDFTLSK